MKPTPRTPGPWHVGPFYQSDVESRLGRVCECAPINTPQAIANARLIAATPELLEAVQEVENWLDHHGDRTDPGAMGLLATCRYVIAKATEER